MRAVAAGVPELLPGWQLLEQLDDRVEVGGLMLHRAAFAARGPGDVVATGAAASTEGSPRARAWGELLERAAIREALGPSRTGYPVRSPTGVEHPPLIRGAVFGESEGTGWRHARSSGVALAGTWPEACHRALLECVERHRVLRSWIGWSRPTKLEPPGRWPAISGYRWAAYLFPGDEPWAGPVDVVGAFGFPLRPDLPLLRGWAADTDPAAAWRRATGECLQGLAFLHEEPIPTVAPTPEPTPEYHLDLFLWPETRPSLLEWLEGAEPAVSPPPEPQRRGEVHHVDLTPRGGPFPWYVAKVVITDAVQLAFGNLPLLSRDGLPHPIP